MTTPTIPTEYEAFDYGFSGVDAPGEIPNAPPPVVINNQESLDKMDMVHADVQRILQKLDSIGVSDATNATTLASGYVDKIRQLEAIIVPLLNNLLKTADKDYIYWPNRKEVIERQLANVLAITRG